MANAFASLAPTDPNPVFVEAGGTEWLLTVEHAGRAVPSALSGLGVSAESLDRHIGWDPGALDLARALRKRLDGTLVAQRYSRLVIDCNRPFEAPDLIPPISDGTPIPRNASIEEDEKRARWDAIHTPFHASVSAALDRGARNLLSVHTYDPRRNADKDTRPWPIGLLWRRSNSLAERIAGCLAGSERALPLGLNEPYEIEDESDYTIPVHAEPRGIGHVLIEVRNDMLKHRHDIDTFADLIAAACTKRG